MAAYASSLALFLLVPVRCSHTICNSCWLGVSLHFGLRGMQSTQVHGKRVSSRYEESSITGTIASNRGAPSCYAAGTCRWLPALLAWLYDNTSSKCLKHYSLCRYHMPHALVMHILSEFHATTNAVSVHSEVWLPSSVSR